MSYQNSLEEQKKIVYNFVEKTLDYARRDVERRRDELSEVSADKLDERVKKLYKWISYIEFQEHTLRELDSGKLDYFFEDEE